MSKTVLVTGASGGIGFACAELLAREGYTVLAQGNRTIAALREKAAALQQEGLDIHAYACDVSKSADVNAMCDEIETVYHHLDAAVLSAGIAYAGLLCDMTDEDWHSVMETNLSGAFYVLRRIVPGMTNRRSGSIVLVSSMWGRKGASCEAAYSASKAGLIGLMEALAGEVGPSGVRVNCVAPGVIDTRMMDAYSEDDKRQLAEETPLERLGTPADVAGVCAFLLSDRASFITGQTIGVDGGFL